MGRMGVNVLQQPGWLAELLDNWIDALSPFQLFFLTLVLLFGSTAVFLATYALVLMQRSTRRQQWMNAFQSRVEDDIAIWLSGDYTTSELVSRLQEELKKDLRASEAILNIIFATSKVFRREGQPALLELLISLNLHLVCFRLLKSGHWYQQAYATRIISQLQLAMALPLLKDKLTTQNATLRIELIIAMVSLGDQSWLRGDDLTTIRLSDWEQILLLERLRRLDTAQLPLFDSWLAAEHPDWILFGVRLCRHYNRFDRVQEMGALLQHADERIQMAVLDAFDYLGTPETIPYLIAYIHQATGNRLTCALKILGDQGDPDTVNLLIPYTAHADPAVQMSALSALKVAGLSKDELRRLTINPRYIDHLFDPKLS